MEELTNQGSGAPEPPQNVSRPAASATLAWLRDLSLSVLIAIIVILFLYQPVKVEGTSMMPSLIDQERIFINKFIYRFGLADVGRGDTVVFWFPGDPTKSYIKRVIGIPGDTIEVNDGTVIVNGKPLEEDYVPPDYRDHVSMRRRVVPPGQCCVLGDHRGSANDTPNWGTAPRRYIYGKAVFAYWPPHRIRRLH